MHVWVLVITSCLIFPILLPDFPSIHHFHLNEPTSWSCGKSSTSILGFYISFMRAGVQMVSSWPISKLDLDFALALPILPSSFFLLYSLPLDTLDYGFDILVIYQKRHMFFVSSLLVRG